MGGPGRNMGDGGRKKLDFMPAPYVYTGIPVGGYVWLTASSLSGQVSRPGF